jgi:hypothetical protein
MLASEKIRGVEYEGVVCPKDCVWTKSYEQDKLTH